MLNSFKEHQLKARKLVILILATLALINSACASSHISILHENELLNAAMRVAAQDNLSALQEMESKAITAAESDADREGNRLMLHLRSGATKTYEDRSECKQEKQEANCQTYRLIAYARSRGFYVVVKGYYEGADYILISDLTGDETVLRGFPYFSPSGNYVLVLLMNDQEVGFEMQIFRREKNKFVLDWRGAPHTNGMYTTYKLLGWQSENVIELQSENDFGPSVPYDIKRFDLRFTPRLNVWRIFDVSSPAVPK